MKTSLVAAMVWSCVTMPALLAPGTAQGQTIATRTVNETTHVRYNGGTGVVNGNYLTGEAVTEYRSGFIFSTAGAAPATAISITFNAQGMFATDGTSETLGLFDYVGNTSTLAAGSGGTAAFTDLGSGTQLGSYTLTAANGAAMPTFTVSLSQAFVNQYNASIGTTNQIALGAAITSISGTTTEQEFWGRSGPGIASFLSVQSVVPEPSAWTLMILGFGIAGTTLRRRRARLATHVRLAL